MKPERMREAATQSYSNATDLADYLVRKGLEFRKAHEIVGQVVMHAIEQEEALEHIPLAEYREFSEVFDDDLYASLSVESSLAGKSALGGTSPERVNEAMAKARNEIDHG